MYNHLSNATPDIAAGTFTLNIDPHQILTETGSKSQEIVTADDGSETCITYSNSTRFYVTLQWTFLSSADATTIWNAYHNATRGNGMANSFVWSHPTDSHNYVVKFAGPISRNIKPGVIRGISQIKLRVLGNTT